MNVPLFPLGRLVATPNALSKIPAEDIQLALSRHVTGDWGECCPEDKEENDYSLTRHLRLLSVYRSRESNVKFWIITEADRSVTTVLLPSDY